MCNVCGTAGRLGTQDGKQIISVTKHLTAVSLLIVFNVGKNNKQVNVPKSFYSVAEFEALIHHM